MPGYEQVFHRGSAKKMSIWSELENYFDPIDFEEYGGYIRWLKGRWDPTFSGQDLIRFFLNNLEPREKKYVVSFFKEFYTREILTDGWNLDYTPDYQSSLWDLILSSWDLCFKISTDLIGYLQYGEVDVFWNAWYYLQEGYRLWSGWIVYWNQTRSEIQSYAPPGDDPPWWAW